MNNNEMMIQNFPLNIFHNFISKLSPLAKSGHKCYKNMSKKSTDPTFNIGKYILREKWQAVKIPQALELKSSIRD